MIQISTARVSSRQSKATKSAGFDNAGSEWSHVAWAMLMPCGSRKDGIVKGSLKNREHSSSRASKATRDLKKRIDRDSSHTFRNEVRRPKGLKAMTKQRFVIGEFISVTMNEPMLFCFVIGEFCSNRSNVALPPLRQ